MIRIKNLPGEFDKNIGGGGTVVPLMGETHELSIISCCSTERYDVTKQYSSKLMYAFSTLLSQSCCISFSTSSTCFKVSTVVREGGKPSHVRAF